MAFDEDTLKTIKTAFAREIQKLVELGLYDEAKAKIDKLDEIEQEIVMMRHKEMEKGK